MIKVEESVYHPKNERYLAGRLIGRFLPLMYGSKGQTVVKLWTYFRGLDDKVDDSITPNHNRKRIVLLDEKASIIKSLIGKESPLNTPEAEAELIEKPLKNVPQKETILKHCLNLVAAMKEEFEGGSLTPRTYGWLLKHNIKLLEETMEIMSLVINGRSLKPTNRFRILLAYWNLVGELSDLGGDIARGIIDFPFTDEEVKEIKKLNQSSREKKIREIISPERFEGVRGVALMAMKNESASFLELNMPFWQKILILTYMLHAQHKAKIKSIYPFNI